MKRRIILAALGVVAVPALAADVYCLGTIEDWSLTKTGSLYVDGTWNNSSNPQLLCTMSGGFDGVSSDICKGWLSTVMAAKLAKQQVRFKYSSVASCDASALGTGASTVKAPEYIGHYL